MAFAYFASNEGISRVNFVTKITDEKLLLITYFAFISVYSLENAHKILNDTSCIIYIYMCCFFSAISLENGVKIRQSLRLNK